MVANGFEMFLFQGMEQFRIWTGKEAPAELMRNIVLERLRNSK
jgi:shikimate dehydrogenase